MTIIEQYHAAKRTHPNMLLLFRVGNEYQLFDEDAKTVGETSRPDHDDQRQHRP